MSLPYASHPTVGIGIRGSATLPPASVILLTIVSRSVTLIVQTYALTAAISFGPAPRRGSRPPSMPRSDGSPVLMSQYGSVPHCVNSQPKSVV